MRQRLVRLLLLKSLAAVAALAVAVTAAYSDVSRPI